MQSWLEKNEKISLGVIAAIVMFAAFFHLRTNPAAWFDEGIYYQAVRSIAHTGNIGVPLSPTMTADAALISVGYSVFYPAALVFKIFGDSFLALRLTAVGFLLGMLVSSYVLVRKLYGVPAALYAAVLLSLFSPLYGNGKNFLGEVPGLFYVITGLAFAVYVADESVSKRRPWLWWFAGIFFGLAMSAKPTFLIILPALAVGFLWKWKNFFRERRGRRAFLLLLLGIIPTLGLWYYTQFGGATSLTRVYAHYSNPYYVIDLWPLIISNLKRFVTESTPAHFLILFIFTILFLANKLYRRISLHFVEVVTMAFIGATIIFYLRTFGWYRYFFPAHALLFLFFLPSLRSVFKKFTPVVLCLFLAAQGYVMAQERFSSRVDDTSKIEPYIQNITPADGPLLFYNIPHVAARYEGGQLYQYLHMSDQVELGQDNKQKLQNGFFETVVAEDSLDVAALPCYNQTVSAGRFIILKRIPGKLCVKI